MSRCAAVLALVAWGGAARAQESGSLRPAIEAAGFSGIAGLSYDRVSGVALPVGVNVTVPGLKLSATPLVTYRSQLGALDPGVSAQVTLGQTAAIELRAAHGVFTNDAWIRNDLVNSAEYLMFGEDTRNYFRATRGELLAKGFWHGGAWAAAPEAGVRIEQSSSVRAAGFPLGGPFTFLNKTDSLDRLRPNVPVQGGAIQSALAGVRVDFDSAAIVTHAHLGLELARVGSTADGTPVRDTRFAQATLDGSIRFPTFRNQSFRLYAHAVATSGGDTPRQRWAYLGGPGTLPTIDLLALGGDQLLFIDARYAIPLRRPVLPLVGSPVVELRETIGGAAFGRTPVMEQVSGVHLSVSYVYAEVLVDPVRRRPRVSAGISVFN